MRQVVLDTETTGLSAADGDRVIEIGCVELLNRQLSGRNLHMYLNPERAIHEEAQRVHGLSIEFLSDKPKFAQIVDELLDYLAGAELVIHNAPFDVGFLNAELARLGRGKLTDHVSGVLDTLALAKSLYPGKRNGLDALCDRLDVDNSGRHFHGALLDAELLADVYINMTRGQNALDMDAELLTPTNPQASTADGKGFDMPTNLPILMPNPEELSAHAAVLAVLDKASKGKTVWNRADLSLKA